MAVARPEEPTPLAASRDPTAPTASSRRRQSSLRDQRFPAAPSALQASPSKRLAPDINAKASVITTPRPYTQNPSSISHIRQVSTGTGPRHSIASTGLAAKRSPSPPSGSFDFLPSVNFDDLHSSIFHDVPDINSFPAPAGKAFQQRLDPDTGAAPQRPPMMAQSRTVDTADLGTRIGLNGGSIRRHGSGAQRGLPPSHDNDPTTQLNGSLSKGSRRKSYFPSAATSTVTKTPRKSVGPGILTSGFDLQGGPRRPSLAQAGLGMSFDTVEPNTGAMAGSQSANFESTRYQKAKSFQAPPRKSSDAPLTPTGALGNFESFANGLPHSPARSNLRTTTPSSNKRMSVLPNSAHATGLAARTISPTDALRMKRMSMKANPPPMPFTPTTPQPDTPSSAGIPSAPSPPFIPRKSVTPSSSRTTPDPNRKSYSSGFSISSSTSYNSNNGPNSSARMSQSLSTSRLPTPKSRVENLSQGDEEMVPPVPAIPKAYESPKDESHPPFFSYRKSSLAAESNSVNSNSTSGGGAPPSEDQGRKMQSNPIIDKPQALPKEPATERKQGNSNMNRRTLQPLRLPPLNLLPLSTPTASKIAALYDGSTSKDEGAVTPPPKKGTKATPTTPMTASKASFSRGIFDDSDNIPFQVRSSSSHHTVRPDPHQHRAPSSSSTTGPNGAESQAANTSRSAISPYVSSSLPKSSGEFSHLRREMSNPVDASSDQRPSRLTGPRLQKPRKASKDDGSSMETASPIESSASSFGSSLRRKLSLTRKRSASKAQSISERDAEMPPNPPKHSDMPPPRLPASATWSGPFLPSPTPSQKQGNSRNFSNTSAVGRDERNRSSTWDSSETPKKAAKPVPVVNLPGTKRTNRSVLEGASAQSGTNLKELLRETKTMEIQPDRDDMLAEEEMRRLASKRKETELAAKELDALTRRATAKDRVSPASALRVAKLNIFERGEIVDYKDIFFCGTQNAKKHVGDLSEAASNFGYDDERGDYNIVPGDHLAYRYEIVDVLGKGSFGQVVRCVDHRTGTLVAIKIIRNKKRFHQQALVEVDILQKLREWDPHNKHSMVSFTQSFYFRGHLCISTELLGMNLYEFIKCHDFRGFSLKLIRRFAKQLISSLLLLKSKKVIHCDLKPENVLLAHPARSEIKVIDFGSSCLENEKVYTYIQSRFYRSPEVILGMSYGMAIDMWSLGCILAELLTGYPIFPGENEQEQLACIMEVFGPPEKHLIEKSTRKKLFFDSLGKPRITVSSKGKRRRPSSKSLQQALKCEDEAFLDFITRCLRWDPDRRLKPDEAIAHEFLTGRSTKAPPPNRPRTAPSNTFASPVKRHNSVSQSPAASTRPLPEPPTVMGLKTGTAVRNRDAAAANAHASSPIKYSSGAAAKRVSTVNMPPNVSSNASTAGTKRLVNGAAVQGSALPRVASTQRAGNNATSAAGGGGVVSSRAEGLAAAAAAASLATRSR
ncbi:MAG: serine/threonine protein kinase, CMGC, dual-specificity [Ramalina farinacea]|uniref:Serine/threonine protein kinase, CMGC, dual-specificity n=1 Tax=Ramalina farinacea TaxID=258253 RepID=A0AA43QMI8_9LECA|nr:serine/threonine protein kinase, CMGC, dual-specificity [Ramalina farinacea]